MKAFVEKKSLMPGNLIPPSDNGLSNPEIRGLATNYVGELAHRHPKVKIHSERVARLAIQLADFMGLPMGILKEIELVGALHDIGKVYLSKSILDKPDELSPLELESLREIPLYSATIAHQLGLSGKIQEAISQRHERPDGLGYPFGLHEDEISPLSKIIAVSDTFDSLTVDQPYRKRCSPREAIGIIRSKSQFQFDPEVVDALTLLILPSH